ncbi:peroxin-14 [Marchantia polymorpha subsp. ruderalis]|uniref:RING-type domain-containing protein n=2 Tax=Marchantia polymorpha TaxID=3197 RepID=A0AAF6ATN8_MARPO|nr:hypothetical protein MARPO_0061s0121 [Marchantia polymorpha]BBM99808.1 hypothetical protein Mp_1g23990 [Marchantia polymorpha subsp. ruderalis]|eukprot:PTQ36876.1 hypothetical protein MARPO_0061s0121 [Marchantia polymorpha]
MSPHISIFVKSVFDGFFLSMLATSVIVVSVNWQRYNKCTYPLHIWIVVDYATVFLFRVFMFIDNGLAAGMGPDASREERDSRFKGRVAVISFLTFILYPFLWAWTVIGSLWFTDAKTCLPEEGQKWGFLIWLVFSYCGLICVACISAGKWLLRRQAHLQLVSHGSAPVSEFQVLFELIRVPDWAFLSVASGQENNIGQGGQDTVSYHPGLYLSPLQREEVEKLIQELPKFRLKGVPSECTACPICLDEFEVGTEVRGLPCAHNFHVACIDEWLRLNVKCPHCRCPVFPELDFSAGTPSPSQPYPGTERGSGSGGMGSVQGGSASTNNRSRLIRAHPGLGQSNLLRLQDLLRTMHSREPHFEEPVANVPPQETNYSETPQGPDQSSLSLTLKVDDGNSGDAEAPPDTALRDISSFQIGGSGGAEGSRHHMEPPVVVVVDRSPLDRM